MGFPFFAGARLTADDLNDIQTYIDDRLPLFKQKASNQTVVASTTYVSDADFTLTLAANTNYYIRLVYAFSQSSTGDVKIQWVSTGTAAALTTRATLGPTLATTDVTATSMRWSRHSLGTSINYGLDTSSTGAVIEEFVVTGGASGGTVTPQIACNSAAGTLTASTNSFIIAQIVGAL